ncbi:MAG TPA: Hint domain-containing protein [Chitinophaga sp.]
MRKTILSIILMGCTYMAQAQGGAAPAAAEAPRVLSAEEYAKAKTFKVKDLDNDTYAKFENTYVLDRYEMRKPYFITGDDGLKKRIDLYKLIAKEGMQELGTMIYYTNEKGTLYTAVLPGFRADAAIWEKYFEDLHAIDKEEKNFVLKLSYVLSKEFGFQQYKSANQGKNLKAESGTYSNNICFPGTQQVTMADGVTKALKDIRPGDLVVSIDPVSRQANTVKVKELVAHAAENYAITSLLIVATKEQTTATGTEVRMSSRVLQATPNHPMMTSTGKKPVGAIKEGEQIICQDERTHTYETFTVFNKTVTAAGVQPVYNIVADGGSTFLMNGVMVLQK